MKYRSLSFKREWRKIGQIVLRTSLRRLFISLKDVACRFLSLCGKLAGKLPADVRGEKWMKKISVEKGEDRK